MEIPAKWVQIECALDFHLITNQCLQQNKSVFIKCTLGFHFIENDYAAHFATPCSFFSILFCRASPKLSISTSIVFIELISEVMPSRIDYLSVISFWCYSSISLRYWYFAKNALPMCMEYVACNYVRNFCSNWLFINSILPSWSLIR